MCSTIGTVTLWSSTHDIQFQIYSAVSTFLSFNKAQNKILRPGRAADDFCKKLLSSSQSRHKTQHIINRIYIIGAYSKVRTLPNLILEAFLLIQNVNLDCLYHF